MTIRHLLALVAASLKKLILTWAATVRRMTDRRPDRLRLALKVAAPAHRAPGVIALVFHQGEEEWNHPNSLSRFFRLPDPVPMPEREVDLGGYRVIALHGMKVEDLATEPLPRSMLEMIRLRGGKAWRRIRNAGRSGEGAAAAQEDERLWLETVTGPLERTVGLFEVGADDGDDRLQRHNDMVDMIVRWAIEEFRLDMTFVRDVLERTLPGMETSIMHAMIDNWRQEGRVEGRVEGRIEGMAEMLIVHLESRFRKVPKRHRRQIKAATPEQIHEWYKSANGAASLDAVFGGVAKR